MATEKTDVVIIGVGAAGGILAAELGKAGMKVIGLERGPRLTTQDFNPHDDCATSSVRICARTSNASP
jgi:gluconate 2-dehydrogenase alpha chain